MKDPVDGEVEQLLINGQKIAAIKLVRERKGFDLKAAKEYVEGVAARMPPGSVPASHSGTLFVGLVVVLILALTWWLMRSP